MEVCLPFYRVYFNRKNEQPQVWSVDEGRQTSEMNIIGAVIHMGVLSETYWDREGTVNRDTPCAWVKVHDAILEMKNGVAHFYPTKDLALNLSRTPDQVEEDNEREVNQRLDELP